MAIEQRDLVEQLRQLLIDAFDGAANGLRAGSDARSNDSRLSERPEGTERQVDVLPLDRLALSVEEAAERLGIGRSSAYEAIRRGDIPTVRFGRRVVVPVHALVEQLGQLTGGRK